MVGLAAAGAVLRNPPPRRRGTDAHAACVTLHAESRSGYLFAGVLVLDVGCPWRDFGRSIAGYSEDHL
jgi:hypothetical protein